MAVCLQEYRDGRIMTNSEKAQELRKKQAEEAGAETKTAQASTAQAEIDNSELTKVQEELENAKLLLADVEEAKEELVDELDEVKKERDNLKALVAEKQKQINALKDANTIKAEKIEELTTEKLKSAIAKDKSDAKADPKKK